MRWSALTLHHGGAQQEHHAVKLAAGQHLDGLAGVGRGQDVLQRARDLGRLLQHGLLRKVYALVKVTTAQGHLRLQVYKAAAA